MEILELIMKQIDPLTGSGFIVISVCLSLLILLFQSLLRRMSRRQDNKPPLVPGIPILGNILDIDKKCPHLSLTQLSEKHGAIYRIKILSREIVVVNSKETINQVIFGKETTFSGRPHLFRISYGFHNAKDLIFGSYDEKWVTMKKIVTQSLRQFATGRATVENIVKEEMETLITSIDEKTGQNFDPTMDTLTAVVNALSASVMGRRFAPDDPQMIHYKITTRLFSEACSVTQGTELDMFPWLRYFPNQSFEKLTKSRAMLDAFIDKELEIRKKVYCPENIDCILDALIQSAEENKNGADDNTKITKADVRTIFIDILVSGTFTTSIAMNAFLLVMANKPDIQKKLQEEIDRNIGNSRLPVGQDRSKNHLMEAAILETLRYISHVPLCLPHFTLEDAHIDNYEIKKNTEIFVNLWKLHHDPTIWEDPWAFNPNRFLDENGELLSVNHEGRKSLLPFGGGRRMCVGEKLARERIFLYLSVILQHFTISPPDGAPLQSCDPRDFQLGLILEPVPFLICATRRDNRTGFE